MLNSSGIDAISYIKPYIKINYDNLKDINRDFNVTEWIGDLKKIKTPKTIIIDESHIKEMMILNEDCFPNGYFVRLDSCSSKNIRSYSALEYNKAIEDIKSTDRTHYQLEIDPEQKWILRDWKPEWHDGNHYEIRIFIYNGEARAISINYRKISVEIVSKLRNGINNFTKQLIEETDYDDCTADVITSDFDNFELIEINSPVYISATSGNFDLSLPRDLEILFGDVDLDVVKLPVIAYKPYCQV